MRCTCRNHRAALLRLLLSSVLALVMPGPGCKRKSPSAERVKLSFWHIQCYEPTVDVVNAAVERFRKKNPDIELEAVPLQNDAFKQKLKVAMGAGRAPDVFHTWGGGALKSYVEAGRVMDLTKALEQDAEWKQRLDPRALEFATFTGRTCAIPADVTAVPFFYDKALFDKHGLSFPNTFDELLEVCRRLRAEGVVPIALGNSEKWPGAFFFVYLAVRAGGTSPFRAAVERQEGGTFKHPSFTEAGELLQKLVKAEAFPEGFNGMSFDQARRLFFARRAGMMLMGTWLLAHAKKEAPELLDELECAPFPTVDGGSGDASTVVGGINAAYAVSSECRSPAAAIALLKELTSAATASQWAATGRIPALRRELVEPALPPQSLPAARILFSAKGIQLYYDQYLPPRLAEKHKETTQSLFALTMSPTEAAEAMEQLAEEMSGN